MEGIPAREREERWPDGWSVSIPFVGGKVGGIYYFRPWKTRVTSVEAGIGTPNASPAFTTTYTPQQIADFLTKYLFSPASGPEGKSAFVRDSAAAASVPVATTCSSTVFLMPVRHRPQLVG